MIVAILIALLPTCQTEDSTNCTWDAKLQGNGQGISFIALGDLTLYYWSGK